MKTEPTNGPDFKAWRDLEPPGDFTQNVMRRIRTEPVREPSWREAVAAFFASRAAFATALVMAVGVSVVAVVPAVPSPAPQLAPNSLIVAYAKLAGGK